MTITGNAGNVGIGNTNPDSYSSAANTLVIGTTSGNKGMTIASGNTSYGGIYFADGTTGNETYRGFVEYGHSADSLNFGTAAAERMRISSAGNLLVGLTSDFGYLLSVNGTAYIQGTLLVGGAVTFSNLAGTGSRAVLADASGNLSAPVSDISVKQNISSIGYGLNEILKMNPVWFDFIDGYKNYGEGRQNGNIAQEMKAIIPEAVFTTPSTNKMGINYDQLHAVYIKAIQELKAELDTLKNK
jgi:hypothetical protein